MSRRIRVRVLVGDLSLTGVPIVLLRYLEWATAQHPVDIDVVARAGGLLQPALGRVATVTVLEPSNRRSISNAAAAGLSTYGRSDLAGSLLIGAWRRRIRRLPQPDVVLVHGAGGWPLVATSPGAPVVFHLHESTIGLDRSIPLDRRASFLRRADRIMAVTPDLADLAVAAGASSDRVEVVPGVGDPRVTGPPTDRRPTEMVAGAGTPGWRKGTDRFIGLSHALRRSRPSVSTCWVGGRPTGSMASFVEAPDPVVWHDPRPDPWTILGAASVLVVPSREDPLPLVAIEAAQHGVPVVAGAVGGLAQLLTDGRGALVPIHDARRVHATVSHLLDDHEAATDMASAAAAHVASRYSVAVVAPVWWSILAQAAQGG